MEWIKVSDKDPPLDTPLLIAVDTYLAGTIVTGARCMKYSWSKDLVWFVAGTDCGDNEFINEDITHWAIPELPKE